MSYKLSKRDINSINNLYKIGTFLAVHPSYNFKKSKIVHPIRDKILAIFLTVIIIIATCYSIYMRLMKGGDVHKISHVVLDLLNEIFLVFVFLSIIINGNYRSSSIWVKLLNNMQLIDKRLGNVNNKAKNLYENIYTHTILLHLLYCIVNVITIYTWFSRMGIFALQTYVAHNIITYYDFYAQLMMFNLVASFKCRYNDLNSVLNHLLHKKFSSTIHQIREVHYLVRIFDETLNCFNDIYGWSLVFMSGRTVIQLLTSINYSINDLKITNAIFKRDVIISNIGLASMTLFMICLITLNCSAIALKSNQLVRLCYEMQETLPVDSKEREELYRLARHFNCYIARFTAAGFFDVDKTLLFRILSNTTTYLIVLIQFNHS